MPIYSMREEPEQIDVKHLSSQVPFVHGIRLLQGNITQSSLRSHVFNVVHPKPKCFYDIHDSIGFH